MGGFSEIAAGLRPYPDSPGFKTSGTSEEAAKTITSKASVLRERVLAEIAAAGPSGLTADQVGARLGEDWRAVRPRVSELRRAGKVAPTGERRANDTGLKATVWKAVP
jgi:hypothetical protein